MVAKTHRWRYRECVKLLTAIFGYQRYYLLKNTIDSFCAYGPDSDLLIIDDGSDDPRLLAYLAEIKKRPRVEVIQRDRENNAQHGGLYPNMNLAVDKAIEGGYSHIFFLQDDVQFMWKDETFCDRVEHIFKTRPDAAMVNCFFFKGIIARQLRDRLIPFQDADTWHISPYGIVDIGIMPVSLLQEKKWRFGNTENGNSRHWVDWGYKLYALRAPTLAFIPWPQVRASGKSFGHERKPRRAFFLKPLDDAQIATLKAMPLSDIPYQENFCPPWGWKCLSPYWFTKFSWKHYTRYLKQCIKDRDFYPKLSGVR